MQDLSAFFKRLQPLKEPKIQTQIERSCDNCQDYIVCYGFDEAEDPSKGATCPDWHLDFIIYQDLINETDTED